MTNFIDASIEDLRERYERMQDEPAPVQNEGPDMWLIVMADMRERRQIGINRYGIPLQPYNGRRALRDLYYELLDAAVYIRQKIYEEESNGPKSADR